MVTRPRGSRGVMPALRGMAKLLLELIGSYLRMKSSAASYRRDNAVTC